MTTTTVRPEPQNGLPKTTAQPPRDEILTAYRTALQECADAQPEQWAEFAAFGLRRALANWQPLQIGIYSYDEDARALKLCGGYGLPVNAPECIPLGEQILGQAAKSRRPRIFTKIDGFTGAAQTAMFALRPRTCFVYPLIANGKLAGAVEGLLLNEFPESEKPLIDALAENTALALQSVLNQQRIRELLNEANYRNDELTRRERELELKVVALHAAQEKNEELQRQLMAANHNLENQVKERTAELEETLAELKGAQQQLVFSEKMAALGQIVAGVAHEINSPIGAIKASAAVIEETTPLLFGDFLSVTRELEAEHQSLFMKLIMETFSVEGRQLTPKEARRRKRELAKTFEEADVPESADVASELVSAGFRGDPEPFFPLFRTAQAETICQLIYNLGQISVNVKNIDWATDKTRKVVFALKSYAHTNSYHEKTEIDLRESLDTVLTIYYNQLKHGIQLETDWDNAPFVWGQPDELSQIWTNLVQNAIQAMNGSGVLRITAKEADETAVVVVEDNGPGIPAEIQQKIFEPFFTTKKRGEGTGMGLDICRKILQRHDGDLKFESVPGCTRFIVSLPVFKSFKNIND